MKFRVLCLCGVKQLRMHKWIIILKFAGQSKVPQPVRRRVGGETNTCFPKSKMMESNDFSIHGFTISVLVLTLPIFWRSLLRNGKISSKGLF